MLPAVPTDQRESGALTSAALLLVLRRSRMILEPYSWDVPLRGHLAILERGPEIGPAGCTDRCTPAGFVLNLAIPDYFWKSSGIYQDIV